MQKNTDWTQHDDGTWRRTVDGREETTAVNPNVTEGARKAAEEAGVDLAEIEGSGAKGQVTKADVEKATAR